MKWNDRLKKMIDQFFGRTVVKQSTFAMSAYTNYIHIILLIKMNDTIFHILITDGMTSIIAYIIQCRKSVHILHHIIRHLSYIFLSNLEQVNPGIECLNYFM